MNNNRDGKSRHRIAKGKANYWPNRWESVPPAPAEESFQTFRAKVEGISQRALSNKFKEHILQAQLFYNSLADHEKAHLIAALNFELDHCDDEIVYNRIVERLCVSNKTYRSMMTRLMLYRLLILG